MELKSKNNEYKKLVNKLNDDVFISLSSTAMIDYEDIKDELEELKDEIEDIECRIEELKEENENIKEEIEEDIEDEEWEVFVCSREVR